MKRITSLIRYATSHCPYYKKLFQELGATAEDIKEFGDLKKIPVLTKADIQRNAGKILSDRPLRPLIKAKTSGSTGVPLRFYKDRFAVASTYAAMYMGHRWWGLAVGDREARLWGIPIGKMEEAKIRAKDFLLNRFRQKKLQVSRSVFHDFYQKIRQSHPIYLTGYPSYIYLFAKFISDEALDGRSLNLKLVKYTAEMLPEDQKETIESVFGCPCVSEYGSAETGVVSFECPHRNHHIMAGAVFVEFEETDIKIDGQAYYNLIVTNLYNYSFPIIRYRIGDIAAPGEAPCPCGRVFPTILKVIGRCSDVVLAKDGKKFHSSILSYVIKEAIGHGIIPSQIRFVQRQIGKLEIQVAKSSASTVKRYSEILDYLTSRAFKGCLDIEVVQVKSLQRESSGKFRYFVSLLEQS